MTPFALLCPAVVIALTPAPAAPGTVEAYRAAAASAGRDPNAHVRLALWCEAHALPAQRVKHLSLAIVLDPANAPARGLLGFIDDQGRWRRFDDIVARGQADADRAEILTRYHDRRGPIPDTAEAHWQLAEWCEENGLKDEARVHLAAVVRISPAREEAWKKLGCRKQNGRWTTTGQADAERAEADAQRKADAHWRPLLQKWKTALADRNKRAGAEDALLKVNDPRAALAIARVFANGEPAYQARAVLMLRALDDPTATRALASLAVLGGSAQVRQTAADALAGRDPRAFAPWLIGLLRDPVVFEVKRVGGPGKPGELYIKGERANVRRFYAAPPPLTSLRPGDVLGFDAFGLPVANRIVGFQTEPMSNAMGFGAFALSGLPQLAGLPGLGAASQPAAANPHQNAASNALMNAASGGFNAPLVAQVPIGQLMVQAEQQAVQSQRQLQADVAILEAHNADVNRLNDRVLPALRTALDEGPDRDRAYWVKWWTDLLATRSAASPRPGEAITAEEPAAAARGPRRPRIPAFDGATLVWTLEGRRAVESLRVGDKVLSQDTATGALGFATVVTVRRAPREPVKTIAFDHGAIAATALERFWIPARGWVPAGDLAAGDTIRALDGVVKVSAVDDGGMRPVYHLAIADDRGLFVGQRGLLAHDDQLAFPAAVLFDVPAGIEAGRAP